MTDKTIWELEPHTAAKHDLLRRYLGAWFPIMASSGIRRRLIFLDGFAGPGVYIGGEPGSPLIALDTLVNHPQFPRWQRTEFVLAFLEPDPDRHESLIRRVDQFKSALPGGLPTNVRVHVEQATFADAASDILEELDGEKLAPTFAFVDPFGFKGVPMDVLSKLPLSTRAKSSLTSLQTM
jgi:three-Cys-motif partner protein